MQKTIEIKRFFSILDSLTYAARDAKAWAVMADDGNVEDYFDDVLYQLDKLKDNWGELENERDYQELNND